MPDIAARLRDEYVSYRDRIRDEASKMAAQRKTVGPRRRKKLREHIMGLPAEDAAARVLKLHETAGHRDGEGKPCPACRFFEGG